VSAEARSTVAVQAHLPAVSTLAWTPDAPGRLEHQLSLASPAVVEIEGELTVDVHLDAVVGGTPISGLVRLTRALGPERVDGIASLLRRSAPGRRGADRAVPSVLGLALAGVRRRRRRARTTRTTQTSPARSRAPRRPPARARAYS
jgi:hypothetical protein